MTTHAPKFDLLYRGRELNPLRVVPAFPSLVERLRRGEAVAVDLQPGDATRYQLSIVPMQALNTYPLHFIGYRPSKMRHLWMITYHRQGAPYSKTVVMDYRYRIRKEDLEGLSDNAWTPRLLAAWLSFLAAHVGSGLEDSDEPLAAFSDVSEAPGDGE